jgi:hypothetical protein
VENCSELDVARVIQWGNHFTWDTGVPSWKKISILKTLHVTWRRQNNKGDISSKDSVYRNNLLEGPINQTHGITFHITNLMQNKHSLFDSMCSSSMWTKQLW